MVLVAVVSLGALPYVKVPEYRSTTYLSTAVYTAINPEFLLDYGTKTITCSETSAINKCYHILQQKLGAIKQLIQ